MNEVSCEFVSMYCYCCVVMQFKTHYICLKCALHYINKNQCRLFFFKSMLKDFCVVQELKEANGGLEQ